MGTDTENTPLLEANSRLAEVLGVLAQQYPDVVVSLQPAKCAVTVFMNFEYKTYLSMYLRASVSGPLTANVLINAQAKGLERWMRNAFGQESRRIEDRDRVEWAGVPMTFENMDTILRGYSLQWISGTGGAYSVRSRAHD